MQKIILILFCFISSAVVQAQNNIPCGFQRLFTFKPGMNKMTVVDSVNKTYKLSIISRKSEKLPPYKGTGGDSIIKEMIVYNIEGSPCFQGRGSRLQLEFADDKLYKAYISTSYPKSAYNEMVENFNMLRGSIKPHWKFENEIKLAGNNIIGFGFDYSKTKKATVKTEKVTLQYVDSKSNDQNSSYLLEVIWANLEGTRMEGSNY